MPIALVVCAGKGLSVQLRSGRALCAGELGSLEVMRGVRVNTADIAYAAIARL